MRLRRLVPFAACAGVLVGLFSLAIAEAVGAQGSNLALGGATSAVSSCAGSPDLVVDGNTDQTSWFGSCGTGTDGAAWWQVDLGQNYEISLVALYGRLGGGSTGFFTPGTVLVSPDDMSGYATLDDAMVAPGVSSFSYVGDGVNRIASVTTFATGRYVRINTDTCCRIQLAEVEIFGSEIITPVEGWDDWTTMSGALTLTSGSLVALFSAYRVALFAGQKGLEQLRWDL